MEPLDKHWIVAANIASWTETRMNSWIARKIWVGPSVWVVRFRWYKEFIVPCCHWILWNASQRLADWQNMPKSCIFRKRVCSRTTQTSNHLAISRNWFCSTNPSPCKTIQHLMKACPLPAPCHILSYAGMAVISPEVHRSTCGNLQPMNSFSQHSDK